MGSQLDSRTQLTKMTVSLHWVIAIAVLGSLFFGMYLEDLPRSQEKGALIGIHKSVGMLVLFVALYRIYWRLKNSFPERLTPVASWQEKVTSIVHTLLLATTVLMPVSGVIMSVGGGYPVGIFGVELIAAGAENELLGRIGHILHGVGGKVMLFAVAIHVLASIKHAVVTRDGTLQRILGKRIAG